MTIPTGITRLKVPCAVLLLGLWLPATSHCALEFISGLEFLSCCAEETPKQHQDTDCDDDACQAVESGDYKIDTNYFEVTVPLSNWVLYRLQLSLADCHMVCVTRVPAEFTKRWQFIRRAALPVRAP